MADTILCDDFKTDPYWWEAAPRPELPARELPAETDVVVIGSGFTGLSAALAAQRGGRQVLVLEADVVGYGASTRNAGYVGRTLWHKFGAIQRKYGTESARAMATVAVEAHKFVVDFIEKEQISCGFVYCSRFIAACTRRHYRALAAEMAAYQRHGIEFDAELVPESEQRRELGSGYYRGGLLLHGTGAVHPALYHQGLLDRALAGGVEVADRTPVTGVAPGPGGTFMVTTSRGTVRARDVVAATNGYNEATLPWFRRRIVPVKAFCITTEPLAPEVMDRLLPNRRTVIDTKMNIYAIRPTPDDRRLMLFGRTGMDDGDLTAKARRLHRNLVDVFPELHAVKVSHCWEGQMGFTFDKLPHAGAAADGVAYAMGYNGAGLPMGSYLGHRIGLRLAGGEAPTGAFEGRRFPTRPLYGGTPWFLGAVIGYYNMKDRWEQMRG